MADRPPIANTNGESAPMSTTGASRWQKVVGIIGLVVLVGAGIRLFGLVGGGGGHVPGGSPPPAEAPEEGDQTSPEEGGHTPPFDHG
jgi:hypothetical protein